MGNGLTSEQIIRLKEYNVKVLEMAVEIQGRQTSIKVKETEEILAEIQFIFNKLKDIDLNKLCGMS
jgi:hypothetical protein